MDVNTIAILILLFSFLGMIFLRFPVAYAVALASVATLLYLGLPLRVIPQQLVNGVSSFGLMAVPFFILMGNIMEGGGISQKLIVLSNSIVGWMRGGLSMVNIVASFFFGAKSGSAAADTASLGSILIPMMVDEGYDEGFTTAVTISSSLQGLITPPSHNMIIYAMAAGGVSIASLFLAGYIPALMIAIMCMIVAYISAVKNQYPKGDKFNFKVMVKAFLDSLWALGAIIVVVFGVVTGVFTATESAAIAVLYSFFVSVFVYRGLKLKDLWKVMEKSIDTLALVLVLIAASSIFGFLLTILNVPQMAAGLILSLTHNPILIALLILTIILTIGTVLDMAPKILILTPILLPIANAIGIGNVQFGVIMVLASGISLLTPPVGAVLFIGSAIAKTPIERVVKSLLPFYLGLFIILLLVTFFPGVTLWIPTIFGG